MSFRLKTIIGVALIEAVLLLILIMSNLNYLRSSNEQELRNRAYTTAKLFSTTTKDAVLATDLALLESFVQEVRTNKGVVYARVRDRERILAEGGDPEALNRPFTADHSFEGITDGVFDAYTDITVAGVNYGRVEIGLSIDAIKNVIAESRDHAFAIALMEMALVALFSFILGSFLTRELDALKLGTRRVADGDLKYRIPIRGKDELAQAAQAFNDMAEKLHKTSEDNRQAKEEVLRLNEDLEGRVQRRTEELATLNRQLQFQALHDSLTKLPNRSLFYDRLQHHMALGRRDGTPFCLAVMDLDRFKEINDAKGHHTGDLVLQEVAQRLTKGLRESDTVARMGGDEFALLLPAIADETGARAAAERVMSALATPIEVGRECLDVGVSLGLALFPKDGEQIELLMRRADAAMYQAKFTKANYCLYRSELEHLAQERHALQGDLRHAIENQQLLLHYQPKIDVETNRLSGVEALVRWQHPTQGLLYPDSFIALAEQSGLMVALTDAVLRQALWQCAEWHRNGLDIAVAVNISPQNLMDEEFPRRIEKILNETEAKAAWLELEITETGVMTNPILAIDAIRRLSNMGVQVAIDDFGTGYSSMAYLKKLLVAKIKIDKSFVIDMSKDQTNPVIVRATIDLGHNLGLKVVAEGVEDEKTWDRLKQFGCDIAQGYYLGQPLAPDRLTEWLKDSSWLG